MRAKLLILTLSAPIAIILAGGGAQSIRESIELCKEAPGSDYALVLSPSYWPMQKPVIYFMLHGLVGGSHGVIAATASLMPKLNTVMLNLYDERNLKEAQELQTRFSRADWALVQLGIVGPKVALDNYYGYGSGRSCRPLGSIDVAKFDGDAGAPLRDLIEQENSLPGIQ
ncbi:hypothetical protein NLG97_g4209 [Lecanicillium saksenae]|uniref:Uncharacterized protein n=1 Tax=Lecanicillium saksenae TaxID=468837 RepID=A0ACC1QVX1_9HYPO|nr:hypothetical protein NLG97_g4209 [Lecanicillium saksenae]